MAPAENPDQWTSAKTAVHFIHIGKTAGSSIKDAFRSGGKPMTPHGRAWMHRHSYTIKDLPDGHFTFFCLRDPVARFVSSFNSRLRKGQPRFYFEWTEREREAFERFSSPQELAGALAGKKKERQHAAKAMRSIRHVKHHLHWWVGTKDELATKLDQVLYIARQETLNDDWPLLKRAVGFPDELALPSDPVRAHRADPTQDKRLDDDAVTALRDWYAVDYELLEFCEKVRADRGWIGDRDEASARR